MIWAQSTRWGALRRPLPASGALQPVRGAELGLNLPAFFSQAIELDQMGQEGKAIRAELAVKTGRTSMPNIWISGTSVGGCNDGPGVVTLNKEGKLQPMLKAAGAL